jgi:hypothetical protein
MDYKALKLTPEKRKLVTQQAVRDLAKKMSLEPDLIRSLKLFFKKISKDSKEFYKQTGTIMPLSVYRIELTKILFKHYMRVYRNFSSSMRKKSKKYKHYLMAREIKKEQNTVTYTIALDTTQTTFSIVDIDADVDDKILEAAIQSNIERADKQSGNIINVTEKDLEESYFSSEQQSGELGDDQLVEIIISDANETFEEKTKSRPQAIANTETQAIAEKAKHDEAMAVAETIGSDTTGSIPTLAGESTNPLDDIDLENLKGYTIKYWVTMADDRVRHAHLLAEGQVQFANMPFIVDGEELLQPGDESLGASKGNVCNCRCTAVYEYIE